MARGGGVAVTFSGFSVAMERLGRDGLPHLELELHRELHRRMRAEVDATAPVGSQSKRRDGELVGPGEYRRGIKSYVNRGGGNTNTESALARLQPGQTSAVIATSPHSRVLEGGRRLGKHRRGRAGGRFRHAASWGDTPPGQRQAPVAAGQRMLGSPQAPRGIFGPAVDRTRADFEQIAQGVIDRAEEGR